MIVYILLLMRACITKQYSKAVQTEKKNESEFQNLFPNQELMNAESQQSNNNRTLGLANLVFQKIL